MKLLSVKIFCILLLFSPCPEIFFGVLFLNALNLCLSLKVRDQISHPYKTRGKITILYILIFVFLNVKWKTKDS